MRSGLLLLPMPLTIALCLAHGTCFAQDHAVIDPRQVLGEFDIFNDGDCLLVPVEIAGKTYRFLVGTGATYTAFDTSLVSLLGAPVERTPNGVDLYLEPNGKVGKMRLQTGNPARIADLTQLRKVLGHNIDGFLGMSFLSTKVVHLDFDGGKLYFLRERCTQTGECCPLHFNLDSLPLVDVDVPGAGRSQFLLNTGQGGCASGSLDRRTFTDLLGRGLVTSVADIRIASLSGTKVIRQGQVGRMSLGNISLPSMNLGESDQNSLGLRFLMRYNVTFDFTERKLYLTKNRRFGEPDRIDRSGLHLLWEHSGPIVQMVDPGSPADKSGIRPGDVITEIVGKNPSQVRLQSLRLLLCNEGATLPMTLRRGQQQINVILHLLGSRPLEQKDRTKGRSPFRWATEQSARHKEIKPTRRASAIDAHSLNDEEKGGWRK